MIDLELKIPQAQVEQLLLLATRGLMRTPREEFDSALALLRVLIEALPKYREPEPAEEFPTPQVAPASAEPVIEIAPRDVKEISDFLRLVEDSKNSPVDQVALMREAAGNLAGYLEGLQYEPDPTAGVFLRPKTPLEAAQYWSRQQATWLAEKKDLEDRLAGGRARFNRLREVMKYAEARLEATKSISNVGNVRAGVAQVQLRLRRALGSWFYDGEPDEPELTPPAYNPRSEESPDDVPAGVAAVERAPAGHADPNFAEALRLLEALDRAARIYVSAGGTAGYEDLDVAFTETREFLGKMEGE